MRGEYSKYQLLIQMSKGSPPHAWGILFAFFLNLTIFRITPTCVGNTYWLSIATLYCRDHPHMRGEYPSLDSTHCVNIGSPPHAWGILGCNWQSECFVRITPTCVGNTILRRPHRTHGKDHPHMRGEYNAVNVRMPFP